MTTQLTKNVFSVGVSDPNLRVFDVVMATESGTTYNSFLIKGSEKTAVVEMVKEKFHDDHIANLKELVDLSTIDYVIISHCEPDHSGSLGKFLELCPNAQVIGSNATSNFIPQILNDDIKVKAVKDGDTISLGDIDLEFYMAPFLHWPDTMLTYVKQDKALITSDVFGCHYYCEDTIYDADESKGLKYAQDYYYHVIMHPYRTYVKPMLDKVEKLDVELICPAHGPFIKHVDEIISHYKEWTKDVGIKNDPKKAAIIYVSAYGYTRALANTFNDELKKLGFDVELLDAQNVSIDEALAAIDKADAVIFGSPTFTRDALPPIWDILSRISAVAYRNKPACAFGSYGWSGEGSMNITARLKQLGFKIIDPYRIRLKPSDEEIEAARDYIKDFAATIK